jgi:DNA-binding Xre family transcriptional regulator
MNQPIQFQEIASVIKRLLKERGITYRDMAHKLALSESSVKKLFVSNDCSFRRLSQICAILGISVSDLMTSLDEMPMRSHRHTPAQEEFLLANPQAFHLYCKIVFEDLQPENLQKIFNISHGALFKILRSLDKHNLVQLMPDGEIRYPDMGMVLWENAGPLAAKMKREWPGRLLDMVIGNEGQEGYRLTLRSYHMKKSTLAEFIRAFSDLEFEFARRSLREERLERDQTIPVSTVSAVAPRSFIERL